MKKNYPFYALLLGIPLMAVMFLSFSTGQNAVYATGSPGDNGTNCTLCHTGTPETNSSRITINAPMEYTPGETYQITLSSGTGATRQGFQMSAEADINGSPTKVGTFIDDGDNTNQAFDMGQGSAITHTFVGNSQSSWTFEWQAPATDVGTVTFYAAVNSTNMSGATDGDTIHLKQTSANVLSTESFTLDNLNVYPNPVSGSTFNIKVPNSLEDKVKIQVYDILGHQIHQQPLHQLETSVNVSSWNSGVYLIKFIQDSKTLTKRFIKS